MDKINKNTLCTHNCGSCIDDGGVSNSIRKGFETLGNSLIDCALILSSEDYAQSLIKEKEFVGVYTSHKYLIYFAKFIILF